MDEAPLIIYLLAQHYGRADDVNTTSKAEDAGLALVMSGLFLMLVCVLIVVGQGSFWILFGLWPKISISLLWSWFNLPSPDTEWTSITKAIVWVFDCPVSGVTFVSGVALILLGMEVGK